MERSSPDSQQFEISSSRPESSELKLIEIVHSTTSLRLRRERIESDNKDALIFFPLTSKGKPESVKRIATAQSSYHQYIRGARAKVVDSPKNRSGVDGELTVEEFKQMSPEREGTIIGKLIAADTNANNRVRKIIANNYRKTDIELLSSQETDHQKLPARIRVANKSGTEYAPLEYMRDLIKRPQDQQILREFAELLDRENENDDRDINSVGYVEVFDTVIVPKGANDAPLDPDASRFVYELASLWVANAKKQHDLWQTALGRYNQEFPTDPIDPYDPVYFLK